MLTALHRPFVMLVLAATLPAVSLAQDPPPGPFGLSGGTSLQETEGPRALGVHLAALAAGATRAGVSARFEIAYTAHSPTQGVVDLCPQPATPCYPSEVSRRSLTLLSATVNAVYFDPHDAHLWGYWIAGLGLYGVTRSPRDGSYARPGWNLGFGWRISEKAFVEVRYHGIIRPAELRAFLPIVFGVRL